MMRPVLILLCAWTPAAALGQAEGAPPLDIENPLAIVRDAANAVPGFEGGFPAAMNLLILLSVLSLAPAILILCTSFVRIVVVLSLLRQAMGTQTLPPNQVLVGLALFMTFLVMAPTLTAVNRDAIRPLAAGEVEPEVAWSSAKEPLRAFMFDQIDRCGNWGDVYMVLDYRGLDTSRPETLRRRDVDMVTLIPAFILSELKTAFLIGFRIYLPFLVIDLVVASVLVSMGILMLPPVLISMPFKLLLFVLVDGWRLVVGNLLESFAAAPMPGVML
jgi:flagellar biosynthesis protein FliP